METPRLTRHARERCAEMGISTKVAKEIVLHADLTRPCLGNPDCAIARSDRHPGYAVVYNPHQEAPRPVIVTVLFQTQDEYVREGKTYRVVDKR